MGDSFGKFVKSPSRMLAAGATMGMSEAYRGATGTDISDPLNLFAGIENKKGQYKAGDPYGGMSQYPGYGAGGAGSGAYESLISSATNPGDSPWALKSKNAMDLGTRDALDKARATTAGTTAQAMDNLASRGGLSTGARERIEEGGQKSFLDMSQNLNKQNDINFANMQVQDANQKNNMLSAATTAELAKARDMNDYNMRKYEADMAAWGAGKTAEATANSGKK